MVVPVYNNINTVLVLYVDDPADVGTKVKKKPLWGPKGKLPLLGG